MKDEIYMRAAQAASAWGVSVQRVRALANAGLVEAERTRGGHIRIPVAEVERWQKAGGPPAAPQDAPPEEKPPATRNRSNPHPELLGEPSAEARNSAESVLLSENELKKLKIAKETAETQDFFTEREQRQRQSEIEEQRQAAAAAEAQRRRAWLGEWTERALRDLPGDLPAQFKPLVREAVESALQPLSPDDREFTVQQHIDAAVDRVLRPWREAEETQQAIDHAVARLPYAARATWEVRARQAATAAVAKLRNATADEKQTTAEEAVAGVAATYRQHELARKHRNLIELVVSCVFAGDEAKEAVRAALERLPVGTSDLQMYRVKDETLAPFKERQAAQEADEERRRAEQERRDEIEQLSQIVFALGFDATDEEREDCSIEIRERLEELPADASLHELQHARNEVIAEHKSAIDARVREERQEKEDRQEISRQVSAAMPHLDTYLEEEYTFENSLERYQASQRIRPAIESALTRELQRGDMDDHEIRRFIKDQIDVEMEEAGLVDEENEDED